MFSRQNLRDHFSGHSIFSRLFWSFVITSLFIILVATTLYYRYAVQNTERQIREEIQHTMQQTVDLFDRGYLTPIESALEMIEISPSLNNFLSSPHEQATLLRFDIEKQLIQLINSYPSLYRSIRFVDNYGHEAVVVKAKRRIRRYTSLLEPPKTHSPQLTELFLKLKQGLPRHIHFSQIFTSPEGQNSFYAGIAILEPEIGGFGGAVIVECRLDDFIRELKAISYRNQSIASLLSGTGKPILKVQPSDDVDSFSHAIHAGNPLSERPFLTLQMVIPKSILSEQKNTILNSALLIALLAVVVTFIVAWLLSRQIIHPIIELVHASQRLSEGDFTPVKVADDRSEIGHLSQAFNIMLQQLNETMQNHNSELQTRIRAEQALQRSHNDLQLILNSTSEGIFGINQHGHCTFCNHATLKMLGYQSEKDLVGQDIHALIHHKYCNGASYPHDSCPLLNTLQTGEGAYQDDECFWRADQSKFPVKFSAQPIIRDDVVTGTVVTFADISEAHQAEETLRRTQKMDALGKLTGGIAHDFNNLLGVIMGYGELLEIQLQENPKQSEYIRQINNAGERARKLTSRLLTFSRKQNSTEELTNINALLLEEQHMLQKTLTAQITLKLDLEPQPWNVWLDKYGLEDAILNMSINAMQAMPNGGYLTIRTRNIHLDAANARILELMAGEYVKLSLTDSGIGMDTDTRQKIFDPFFTTKGNSGTGLGMSQVYGFTKQAGGGINLYSEPGEGTQLNLYFPRHRPAQEYSEADMDEFPDSLPRGDETILVVDDEPALRALANEILSTHGYRVLMADSGARALDILQHESAALILCDVIMPKMNGYELARQVKLSYPRIKIQMASGFSDNFHNDRVDQKLHEQRLQKPYSSEQLLVRVRQLLDE